MGARFPPRPGGSAVSSSHYADGASACAKLSLPPVVITNLHPPAADPPRMESASGIVSSSIVMAALCPGHPPPGVRAQMAGTKPGRSPAMTIKRSVTFHPIFLLGATATRRVAMASRNDNKELASHNQNFCSAVNALA